MPAPKSAFLVSAVAALACLTALPLSAQQRQRVSPHDTISTVVGGARVTVVYGRPYSKDPKSGEMRKIWGELVPFGKVWRAGADESTMFVTDKALTVGGRNIPAGAYALFLLPQEDGSAALILNKGVGQWGAYTYDEKQDVVRIDLQKESPDSPAHQFTMALERGEKGASTLKMMWEERQYSVPLALQK